MTYVSIKFGYQCSSEKKTHWQPFNYMKKGSPALFFARINISCSFSWHSAISTREALIISTVKVYPDYHILEQNVKEQQWSWYEMRWDGMRWDVISTFSTIPRSPSAITRLTMVPAFWAMEYAEATNLINTVWLEAMTSPKGRLRERCYFQSQLLVSVTWIQFNTFTYWVLTWDCPN